LCCLILRNFATLSIKPVSIIDNIRPLSSTNIEAALKNSKEYIGKLKNSYPDNEISHIFMQLQD
jgi:hypothetical protein